MLCPFRGWNNQKRSIKFSKPNAVNAVDALTFEHHTYPGVARAVGTPEWNKFGVFCGVLLIAAIRSGSFHHCDENWMRSVYKDAASPGLTSLCFEICLISAITALRGIYSIISSVCLTRADTGDAFPNPFTVPTQIQHHHWEQTKLSVCPCWCHPQNGDLKHIKSMAGGGKPSFRLRAHQGAPGVTDIWVLTSVHFIHRKKIIKIPILTLKSAYNKRNVGTRFLQSRHTNQCDQHWQSSFVHQSLIPAHGEDPCGLDLPSELP